VIPLIGTGSQVFQPIHIDDLCASAIRILERPEIRRLIIDPVGPETLSLRQIVIDLRRWLGFSPGRVVEIPTVLVRALARLGDIAGGPINSTALRQLAFGNAGDPVRFVETVGIEPRRWRDALLAHPVQAQDRWHARSYFLRPLLRWTLSGMWIASGVVGLLQPEAVIAPLLAALGFAGPGAMVLAWAACVSDIAIGTAIIARWRPALVAAIQLGLIVVYTLALTYAQPLRWADPFGPLLKNLPIMVAIMILMAAESDR
jgi:DoxX-like family